MIGRVSLWAVPRRWIKSWRRTSDDFPGDIPDELTVRLDTFFYTDELQTMSTL